MPTCIPACYIDHDVSKEMKLARPFSTAMGREIRSNWRLVEEIKMVIGMKVFLPKKEEPDQELTTTLFLEPRRLPLPL